MAVSPAADLPEELLRQAAWIRRLARALAGEGSWEDLEQDTWLVALRGRPDARDSLRPWLARVMRNLARTRARSEVRRGERERATAREEALPASADLAQRAELQRLLVGLVLALDEPFRETLLLRFYEGLEPRAIARRQGVPPATVRTRLKRGIDRIRAELDERSGGERERWLSALAPLSDAAPPSRGSPLAPTANSAALALGGALVVKRTLEVALVLALVLAAGWGVARIVARPTAETASAPVSVARTQRQRDESAEIATPEPANAPSARVPASSPAAAVEDAPDRGLVAVRLVDDATGEPVPSFSVALHGADGAPEAIEELATDAAGRFHSRKEYARGRIDLELTGNRDASDLIQTRRDELARVPTTVALEHAPAPAGSEPTEAELRVPVGPTFRLRVDPPPGCALEELDATLTAANKRLAFDRAHARVRAGAPPWVRFTAAARLLSGGPPWTLTLASADGLWVGAADIASLEGEPRELVDIRFDARARVSGSLRDDAGRPIAREWVGLWGEGASFTSDTNRPRLVLTNADGSFDLRGVPAGAYTLKVEVGGFAPLHREMTLAAGAHETLELALVSSGPRDLALRGRVLSRSGRFAGRVRALASEVEEPHTAKSGEVTWEERNGASVGRFAIAGLGAGRYRVRLLPDDVVGVRPSELEAACSDPEVEFTLLDPDAAVAASVRVLDDATGEPLAARARITFATPDGEVQGFSNPKDGLARFTGVAANAACAWFVLAEGYQPQWGELVADDTSPPLDVRLKRGWGTELSTRTADDRALAGVRVWFDDALAGVTDEAGRLNVALDHRPARVRCERDDLVLSPDSDVLPNGQFRTWLPWLRIVLVPPGK